METDGGPVGNGGSGARYMTATDGSQWVMKATFFGGQAHRYLYANEAVTAQIAHRMGVAVPELAVVELSEEQLRKFSSTAPETARTIVATRLIEPAEALTPPTAAASTRLDRAGIITLDYISWNSDEKPEHVLAQRENGSWKLWPIDHGHTFAVADTLTGNLDPNRPTSPPMPLLAQGVTLGDAQIWIDAAQSIQRSEFYGMVQQLPAAWVVEPDAPEILADVLVTRVRDMKTGLAQHLPESHN